MCVGATPAAESPFRAQIRAETGRPIDAQVVASDLARLFATGRIDHARAEVTDAPEGLVLRYVLASRPAVQQVRLEGAHAVDPAELLRAFHAAELPLLDPRRVKLGLAGVRDEYAMHGYVHAEATTRTEPTPEGLVLVVKIDEGPLVTVASLTFDGPKAVPVEALRKVASTKQGEPYRPLVFERDLLLIVAALMDKGMLEAKLDAPEIRHAADKKSVALKVSVTGGPVFRLGALTFQGVPPAEAKAYRALVPLRTGDVADRSKLLAGMAKIHELRQAQGKTEDLEPFTELDPKKHTVDIRLVLGADGAPPRAPP